MREAYLTGGPDYFDATDAPEPPATEAAALEQARRENVTYLFESVTLTEEFNLKLVGGRYTFDCSDEFTMTRNQKPHPELLRVLRKLTLHMCLLTESLTTQQLYPQPSFMPADSSDRASTQALRDGMESGEAYLLPLLENFRCTAVAWKSKGVVLSGEKKARYRCFGKSLEVKTPVTALRYGVDDVELEDGDYPFFELLYNTLNELRAELTEYLGGKYGEGGEQLQLFGREPEPRSIGDIANELIGALDNDRYTVSVGTPGGEMHLIGKKRKARRTDDPKFGKDAAAGQDK